MAADRELLLIRRALYADALRRGDPLATANAAARLRAHIGDLSALDLAAVRASRRNFGQSIRQARSRRVAPPAPAITGAVPLSRSRRSPLGAVLAVALLALLLASLFARPSAVDEADGGGGAPVAVVSEPVPPAAVSRGRVVLPVAAVVEAVADPVASAAPEAAAPTDAAPTDGANATAGTPGPGGSGTSGTGTGTGSGSGSGSGSGTASPAPTASPTPRPTFATCFVSIPRGFARLCGSVVDARTGRGIAGACVSLGPCTDQSTRTDPNGRWAFVLPVGNGTLEWGLEFQMAGYRTATFTQTSRLGFIAIPTQRLVAGP